MEPNGERGAGLVEDGPRSRRSSGAAIWALPSAVSKLPSAKRTAPITNKSLRPANPGKVVKAVGIGVVGTPPGYFIGQTLVRLNGYPPPALGISLPETKSVLDRLEGLLPRVGLVLHRHNGDVAIRPQATTDPDIRRRLLRLHQARRGLTLTEARVLYRVAQGEVDEGKLSNPDGVALNRLRRAGLVTEDVRPGLTTDTASGLKR